MQKVLSNFSGSTDSIKIYSSCKKPRVTKVDDLLEFLD